MLIRLVVTTKLAEWYLKLQETGNVHNINLVTPEHVVPQVVLSILAAREMGLRIPIIYNTSSFDSLDSLALLDGLVDIYLPDFKVWKAATSKRLLKATDYVETAMESIKAMHLQVGDLSFTSDGIAQRGVLLRHLVMPGKEDEGREIMRWLAENVSRDLYVHIMEQYHPDAHVGKKRRATRKQPKEDGANEEVKEEVRYAEINRAVKDEELGSVRDAAVEAGLWRFCEHKKKRQRDAEERAAAAAAAAAAAQKRKSQAVNGNDVEHERQEAAASPAPVDVAVASVPEAGASSEFETALNDLLAPPTLGHSSQPFFFYPSLSDDVGAIDPQLLADSNNWMPGPGTQFQDMLSPTGAEYGGIHDGLRHVPGYMDVGSAYPDFGAPATTAQLQFNVPLADPFYAAPAQGAYDEVSHADLLSKFTKKFDHHTEASQVPAFSHLGTDYYSSDDYNNFLAQVLTEGMDNRNAGVTNFGGAVHQYPDPGFSQFGGAAEVDELDKQRACGYVYHGALDGAQ
ncbi:hypothetical protein BJY01DRAFT_248460 [Aspergillus pseudoustus]|uniref:Pyruvate formate lyase activating enzyme n=1 Tax=Aspergillus pseudoustus TaxID=1810923 RepID=A0ABR4JVS3_9EURO